MSSVTGPIEPAGAMANPRVVSEPVASGYPGGIFWLNAGVDHLAQLRAIAEGLGIRTERPASDGPGTVPLGQAEIEGVIAAAVTRRGQRCLWVVDDLPPDLPPDAVMRWLGAQPNGEVLVTTRATGYGWMAPAIDLDVLPAADAYVLLTARGGAGRGEVGRKDLDAAFRLLWRPQTRARYDRLRRASVRRMRSCDP